MYDHALLDKWLVLFIFLEPSQRSLLSPVLTCADHSLGIAVAWLFTTVLQILLTPSALDPLFLRSQIFLFLSLCPVPLLWWPFTGDFLRTEWRGIWYSTFLQWCFLFWFLLFTFTVSVLKVFSLLAPGNFLYDLFDNFPGCFLLRIAFTWVLDLLEWSSVFFPFHLPISLSLFTFWGFSRNLLF